jgi:hypothetical protein
MESRKGAHQVHRALRIASLFARRARGRGALRGERLHRARGRGASRGKPVVFFLGHPNWFWFVGLNHFLGLNRSPARFVDVKPYQEVVPGTNKQF